MRLFKRRERGLVNSTEKESEEEMVCKREIVQEREGMCKKMGMPTGESENEVVRERLRS